ncbi:MAG: uracil-DNA glycosylase [Chloroflexota bacterium]
MPEIRLEALIPADYTIPRAAGPLSAAPYVEMKQSTKHEDITALERDAFQKGIQVFGEGNLDAALMLVGEAPGKEEVAAGRPFQGPAGKALDRLLERVNVPRRELWITNLVKIRPFVEGCRNKVNRPPSPEEVTAHASILQDEIRIIRPRVILCLGVTAASALIHLNFKIGEERGRWFPGPDESLLTATYHPAYLLRLRGPSYEAARDAMAADLLRAWATALGGRGEAA